MKILIGNVHSLRNAGDAVLTLSNVQMLQRNFPDALITLAMNDLAEIGDPDGLDYVGSFTYWAKKNDSVGWRWPTLLLIIVESLMAVLVYRLSKGRYRAPVNRRWQSLVDAYLEMDMYVSCAGNFLYSSGRFGLPFVLALYTMFLGALAGKPLYMMPQTIGPLERAWERRLLVRVLSRYRLLLVRDEESIALLEKIGVQHTPTKLIVDSAFSFQGASKATGARLLRAHGVELEAEAPLLGVSLINWGAQNPSFKGQDAYEDAAVFAVGRFLDQYDAHTVLFSQVHGPAEADDDRVPAHRAYTQLRNQSYSQRVHFIERVVQPDELMAAYGWTDLFLGTRLHANVFALNQGVPVVAIQYQPKTSGVFRTLELEEWVIDISSVTGPALFAKIKTAWESRVELRAFIEHKIPTIANEASLAGQLIADDFREAISGRTQD